MAKRTVRLNELVLLIRIGDLLKSGNLAPDRHYHIARRTVNGNLIGACDIAKNALDRGEGYYTVSAYRFLIETLEPHICDFCMLEAEIEHADWARKFA